MLFLVLVWYFSGLNFNPGFFDLSLNIWFKHLTSFGTNDFKQLLRLHPLNFPWGLIQSLFDLIVERISIIGKCFKTWNFDDFKCSHAHVQAYISQNYIFFWHIELEMISFEHEFQLRIFLWINKHLIFRLVLWHWIHLF